MSTEKRIIFAYLELLDRYSYKSISVDMIAREANISRATFYRYFPSKQELMYAIFSVFTKDAVSKSSDVDFYSSLINFYTTVEKNKKRISKIFRQNSSELFNSLYQYNMNYCSQAFKLMHKSDSVTHNELVYVCSGLAGLTVSLINSTKPIDVEQAAADNYRLIPERFRQVIDPLIELLANNHKPRD